jgi:hypothetical protein
MSGGRGGNVLSKMRAERRQAMREGISASRNITTLTQVSEHVSEVYNAWHAACIAAVSASVPVPAFPLSSEAIAALRLKVDIASKLLSKVLPDLRSEVPPPEISDSGSDFIMIVDGARMELPVRTRRANGNGNGKDLPG